MIPIRIQSEYKKKDKISNKNISEYALQSPWYRLRDKPPETSNCLFKVFMLSPSLPSETKVDITVRPARRQEKGGLLIRPITNWLRSQHSCGGCDWGELGKGRERDIGLSEMTTRHIFLKHEAHKRHGLLCVFTAHRDRIHGGTREACYLSSHKTHPKPCKHSEQMEPSTILMLMC